MGTPLFVWLGSGRARKRRVGTQGQLLDRAARAGLPIPPGAILLDEFFQVCLERGLAEQRDGRILTPDPELLHNTLFHSVRLPPFERPIVVRPIVPVIESPAAQQPSPNGFTRHPITSGHADELAGALAVAWATQAAQSVRRDVLLLEAIPTDHTGIAQTSVDGPDWVAVNSDDGWDRITLPRLITRQTPDETLPPFARRLQMLLRGVRRTFGEGEWGIEWADDGRICHLAGAWPAGNSHVAP